jgi:hypothetical protein
LLLVSRSELSYVEHLILHFELPRAAPIEFVVRLDCDCRQKRDGNQRE